MGKIIYISTLILLIGIVLTACGTSDEHNQETSPGPYEAAAVTVYDNLSIPAQGDVNISIASSPELLHAPHIAPPEGYMGFPSLHIASHHDPFAVARDFWHDGAITLWGADEAHNFDNQPVRIRGRGSATWARGQEKRPLRLRFPEAQHMFGSEYPHRDWILLANLFDPSILRNHSAFYLASLLENLDFTTSSQLVHLYVNGKYQGLYQLTDERDPAPGRGPLHFDPDPTQSEYLFEMDGFLEDWVANDFEADIDFFTVGIGSEERVYDIRFPGQSRWDGHLEYLRDHIRYVDSVLRSRDFEAIQQVIDLPSFIDFYLVNEFMKNINVGDSNMFLSLRGQGSQRRVHFGPVWNFDRSAGNNIYSTDYTGIFAGYQNIWFMHLMATPEIFALVEERWKEIQYPISQMLDHITHISEYYEASFLRNFKRHEILGGDHPWSNRIPQATREIYTFYEQVEYLLTWFDGRINWLNDFFSQNDRLTIELRLDWLQGFVEPGDDQVAQWPQSFAAWTQPQEGTLPTIHITTYYNPFTVSRSFWHDGTISLSGAPLGSNFEAVSARFRGRGNSTWWNGEQKRPLRFRFENPQPMMGSSYEAADWILLADLFDRSLMRNFSALYLGSLLEGLSFTPFPHHVNLYVNGEYMGVYLLTDERDIGPGRMQLAWNEDPALSDFFLELDARADLDGVLNDTFVDVNGLLYDIRYPSSSRQRTSDHVQYVYDYLHAVSSAIRRQGFDEILELIDMDSFVDFYIVNELFKEFDIFSQLSVFMYIRGQGDERRLFMGPIWDFDLAAGNAINQPLGYGPQDLYVALFNYWYRHLMLHPEFFDAVATRWNEIVDVEIAQMMRRIQQVALAYSSEFERNFQRHPIMGVPVGSIPAPDRVMEIDNHIGQVVYLLDWLRTRIMWLDDFFNGQMSDYDPLWALVLHHTYDNPIYITIDGEPHYCSITPINLQNRIMLPVEEVAEIFGLSLTYHSDIGIVILRGEGIELAHMVGDLFILVNFEKVDFGLPASLYIRDHIYLPLRTIAESLGYSIRWDFNTRTIIIES